MEVFKCDACATLLKREESTEIEIKEKGDWIAEDKLHFCVACIESVKAWINEFCLYNMEKDRSKAAKVIDENKLLDKENKKESDVNETERF